MTKTLILLVLLVAGLAAAQTTHTATLTWVDTLNPAGTTYNVYRAAGLCSGTPPFSKIASAVTVKTYADPNLSPGNFCYQVTASLGGVESAASNQAGAPVPSFPPTNLAITVQ
jgi:hypothetical protein